VAISVHRSEKSRHLVLRLSGSEIIPEALAAALRDEQVVCGWLRGSGVLTHVELRAYDAEIGALGSARRFDGPVQALALESSIGMADGEPSLSLRALLARDADRGLETLAGEIKSARAVALEVFVTALDDMKLAHALDGVAGVWLLDAASAQSQERPAPAGAVSSTAWSSAVDASQRSENEPRRRPPHPLSAQAGFVAVPARPPRPAPDLDTPFPEPGDAVDHFAFGRGDVLKSDGDRLHVKIHKDGRIREIALGMLRVSRLDDAEDGRRRFRLERRI
jgi:predicted DNA-binding protein with PD1-like motif